jgi:hypothetical protein
LNGLYLSGLFGLVLPKALYDDDFFSLAGDGAGALDLVVEVPQLDSDDEDAPNVVVEESPERDVDELEPC